MLDLRKDEKQCWIEFFSCLLEAAFEIESYYGSPHIMTRVRDSA